MIDADVLSSQSFSLFPPAQQSLKRGVPTEQARADLHLRLLCIGNLALLLSLAVLVIQTSTPADTYMQTRAEAASLVYGTDFEDVTKADAIHLSMGIPHAFGFGGDGGAAVWMEGLDRTSGIACHSGSRCVGMELTNIAKSRRCEFKITNLKSLVGDQLFVSVWLYLPPDWQLHGPTPQWYEIVNPYSAEAPTYLPYSAIHVEQRTTSPVFDLSIDHRDLSGELQTWNEYDNFPLPRGRWFQVEYYVLRSSTDGIVRIWFDGTLVTDRSGLQTEGPIEGWATIPAKIYYNDDDFFSPYRIWIDDLEVYNGEAPRVASVSLNARLDSSSTPPAVLISGLVYPAPGRPVSVTLEFSEKGGTYQEVTHVTSAANGTFSYFWKAPGNRVFMIVAEAQGVKSSAVSVGAGGVPGFPLESLLVGCALGLLLATIWRRKRGRA